MTKFNRVLICNIVPDNLVHVLKTSQAANNFCNSINNNANFDKLFSILPPNYYNKSTISTDKIKYFSFNKKYSSIVSYILLMIQNINCAIAVRNSSSVWFYNISNSNFLCYIVLKFIFNKKLFILLLDHTPSKKKLSLQSFFLHLILYSDGIISVSQRNKLNHSNLEFKAGIIKDLPSKNILTKNDNLIFLFSGVLSEHTGLDIIIEVFKRLPNCNLVITGLGDFDLKKIEKYKNINFRGYLSYDNYLKIYDEVDVCISSRNPTYLENDNNFPSKIIEYFSYNKIVISTIEYPELENFKYFYCDYSIDSIYKTINKIINLPLDEQNKYKDNYNALEVNFSSKSWLQSIQRIELNAYK